MSNKTWKLTVNEEELKALIDHHKQRSCFNSYDVETSSRIHDLTKRLNKDTPEIEPEVKTENKASDGW